MSLVVVTILSIGPPWWYITVVHLVVQYGGTAWCSSLVVQLGSRAWWASLVVQRVGTAWWYSVVVQRVGTLCQLINGIVGLGLGFVAYI